MSESGFSAAGSSGFSVVMSEGFTYQEVSSISSSGFGHSSQVGESLRIVHGFGDRSVNVKNSRFLQESPFQTGKAYFLEQVHGTDLQEILTEGDYERHCFLTKAPTADGWLLNLNLPSLNGSLFAIKTADCAPVMVIHRHLKIGANLHCGWKSALGGILPLTLARFKTLGARIDECLLLIGPSAKSCCYEVSEELARSFSLSLPTAPIKSNGEIVSYTKGNRCFLDIPNYLKAQARHAGIVESHIYTSSECTICNANYFSFRRERTEAGRQLNFLGVR